MNKPSLKKTVILSMAKAREFEHLGENKLVLLTPMGIITGTMAKLRDGEVSKSSELISHIAKSAKESYDEKFGGDEPLDGNDGYIILENATTMPSDGRSYNFKQLVVFYDQIIGVTIGAI